MNETEYGATLRGCHEEEYYYSYVAKDTNKHGIDSDN